MTLYDNCSPRNLSACEDEMKSNIHFLVEWTKDSNLLLNEKKTKQMLITTEKMSRAHDLSNVIRITNRKGTDPKKSQDFQTVR